MTVLKKIDKKLDELGAYYVDYHCGGPHAEACAKGKKKKKKIEEQFDYMVTEPEWKVVSDEKVFAEMANLIMSLEPDQLDDIQVQKVIDIFNEIQAEAELDEAELDEEVKAKRSTIKAKQYLKKYYRTQKIKMKKKKKELDRSIKGKVRKKKEPIMAKGRKTPTGRHKVEYNV